MHDHTLTAAYESLHREATLLAGGLGDLARRAAVYRHIYRASQGNHVFPLIAAHGALWAGRQFRRSHKIGAWLSLQYIANGRLSSQKLEQLAAFCDALRDVNRRVCIDTYTQFHFSRRYGTHPDLERFIPAELLTALRTMHAACECGTPLRDDERRSVFHAHFLHEQAHIVAERVARAAAEFDWPLAKFLAMRPRIRFAYLPPGTCLAFRNFADQQERIRHGLAAFDFAAAVGWDRVELSLDRYQVLEPAFFTRPEEHFTELIAGS